MSNIDEVLEANRAAMDELIQAADAARAAWTEPTAPGKWSPSQVTEHVALTLDESTKVVAGQPSHYPSLPFFIRPLARAMFFKRVLKKDAFPNVKTFGALDPLSGLATPEEARERLLASLAGFERECRSKSAEDGRVISTVFGAIKVEDYAKFAEIHTRHHCAQIRQ